MRHLTSKDLDTVLTGARERLQNIWRGRGTKPSDETVLAAIASELRQRNLPHDNVMVRGVRSQLRLTKPKKPAARQVEMSTQETLFA